MDNASKALIMAGAILIAVALVGLGVYLFNNASSTIYDATGSIDVQRITTENAQFERYAGDNVKGTQVQDLIRKVGTFNARDVFPEDIEFAGDVSGTTSDAANGIDQRAYYTVTMTDYDDEFGMLLEITIDEN